MFWFKVKFGCHESRWSPPDRPDEDGAVPGVHVPGDDDVVDDDADGADGRGTKLELRPSFADAAAYDPFNLPRHFGIDT